MTETRDAASVIVGPVHIRVPPNPSLSRVVRLAASGVASLADFTVDVIEDIKIAVSEVLIALIEHGEGEPVDIEFIVDEGGFTVRGQTAARNFDPAHPDVDLCRIVLAEVCQHQQIVVDEQRVCITARVANSLNG
jgi:hypothetical protein